MKTKATSDPTGNLRRIPAVEKVLQSLGDTDLPRPAIVAVVRRELAALRTEKEIPAFAEVVARVRSALHHLRCARLQPVINGTGILVHTNLGRAPLGPAVVETLAAMAAHYNNLEYDLTGGERGGRAAYLEHNLALLCGAEAATVVNNCAAALVLALRHFATSDKPEVIISRGELIQIGGGFRIPEILEASGAKLREIGTTNKTALADYARAIGAKTALILKVHRSNFFMSGFVDSPATEDIAALAKKKRVPFVEDLGSGAVIATEKMAGVEHEPTPAEVLKRGVDLVTFSGDKLLGGPQAGIIAGKGNLVAALKQEPFFRALRCDKLILAALQTTVDVYLGGCSVGCPQPISDPPLRPSAEDSRPCSSPSAEDSRRYSSPSAEDSRRYNNPSAQDSRRYNNPSAQDSRRYNTAAGALPILSMLQMPNDELRARAEKIIAMLNGLPWQAEIGEGRAQIGGGTLPKSIIPSVTIDLAPKDMALSEFAARLRAGTPPVIGYISGRRFKIDLRTVFPRQDAEIVRAIRALCATLPAAK